MIIAWSISFTFPDGRAHYRVAYLERRARSRGLRCRGEPRRSPRAQTKPKAGMHTRTPNHYRAAFPPGRILPDDTTRPRAARAGDDTVAADKTPFDPIETLGPAAQP